MRIKCLAGLALGAALLCAPASAAAATIWGVAQGTSAANVANEVYYYNPLSSTFAGDYGEVNGSGKIAGRQPDAPNAAGFGYDSLGTLGSGSLKMVLSFVGATPGVGVLTFDFKDLDLSPVNSTTITGLPNFFEALAIFDNSQTKISGGTDATVSIKRLSDTLATYSISGTLTPPYGDNSADHSTNVVITFPNFVIPAANFNLYLSFGSCSNQSPIVQDNSVPLSCNPTGDNPRNNTEERLSAKLEFQDPPQIPEPASMMLLGSGLVGLAAKVRGKKRAKAATK